MFPYELHGQNIKSSKQNLKQVKQNPKGYKYYVTQDYQNGEFDLRFQSMKNSTINKGAWQQIKYAASFQYEKTKIWMNNKSTNPLKTIKITTKDMISCQNQIKLIWLGHASVFISINNKFNILIDPLFTDRIFPLVGQHRQVNTPCTVQELPQIDYVLISHDHFDHCSSQTLNLIYKRFKNVKFIIGRNSKDILPQSCKQKNKIQLSWTKSIVLHKQNQNLNIREGSQLLVNDSKNEQKIKNEDQIKITFVPACHWSKRSISDQNKRLWGGFVIEAYQKKIYFAGDTGYCGLFKQLKQQFDGFDLSFIPIGAYEPNQHLKAQHINPRQAVQVHNEIGSKLSIGIHWGTFPMSHQTPQKVIQDFGNAQIHVKQGTYFNTLNIGEVYSIKIQNALYKQRNADQTNQILKDNLRIQQIEQNDRFL